LDTSALSSPFSGSAGEEIPLFGDSSESSGNYPLPSENESIQQQTTPVSEDQLFNVVSSFHKEAHMETAGRDVQIVRDQEGIGKTKPVESFDHEPVNERAMKRMKNTLAARRYRQRRLEEVELLDKRVKELQEELSTARVEAKWWKMEARRWQEQAQDQHRPG
jgi:hypothetical protein